MSSLTLSVIVLATFILYTCTVLHWTVIISLNAKSDLKVINFMSFVDFISKNFTASAIFERSMYAYCYTVNDTYDV